jgi:hypothetical protein|tara:strand:- start:400 stop:546 length:147 start_codon:yes stop_codon:yes gene_type:complete
MRQHQPNSILITLKFIVVSAKIDNRNEEIDCEGTDGKLKCRNRDEFEV